METKFEQNKGIHPGIVIDCELIKRAIRQRPFVLSLAEHPQTFNAITRDKRSHNTALALKIEKEMDIDKGTLVLLHAYYDIRMVKEASKQGMPGLIKISKSLFWDTEINHIDWNRQYNADIQRVYERGDEEEMEEINRFYVKGKIDLVLNTQKTKPMQLQTEHNTA